MAVVSEPPRLPGSRRNEFRPQLVETSPAGMIGAGGVLALVLMCWATGSIAGSGWAQSWQVVARGHFRIVAWCGLALAAMSLAVAWPATSGIDGASSLRIMSALFVVAAILHAFVQYSQSDATASAIAYATAAMGVLTLFAWGALLADWPPLLAASGLVAGAALWGATTNGMLLGHWYLNQPGLKTWALGRVSTAGLVATVAAAGLGIASAPRLIGAPTEGAALGLAGFGTDLAPAFFWTWLGLMVFTGAVIALALRCVQIKSMQSATGLYYVAILTAGVSEFLVRYLMVGASV